MLPCNVIVEEHENGEVEVSAVDPMASMQAVENEGLIEIATQVRDLPAKVIKNVQNIFNPLITRSAVAGNIPIKANHTL